MSEARIRCAIVGYGPAFNWGWMHARWLQAVPGMQVVALCDRSPECAAKARQDFPDVTVFPDLTAMLRQADIDLVTTVTPGLSSEPVPFA